MATKTQPAGHLVSCLVLFVLASLLSVACAELGLRVTGLVEPLQKQYPGMISDPFLPYRPRPDGRWVSRCPSGEFSHEVQYNHHGLRDVDHEVAKADGVFRILGLGDSFTYGVGASFEETYLRRVERRLARRPGLHPPVEVIKAGIPRYFPQAERLLLEHYGLRFEPNLVTVGFVPNDVSDTARGLDAVAVTDEGYLRTREAQFLGHLGRWLFLHSHLARGVLSPVLRWAGERSHPVHWPEIYREGGFHEKDWLKVEAEYGRMAELAHSVGAEMVIIHIPQRGPWASHSEYPARRLSAWAEAHGVHFVDALPGMKAAASSEQLYWTTDPHCTPAGYRVVANALYAKLEAENLVP